jgi:transcription antitermination factor NusG
MEQNLGQATQSVDTKITAEAGGQLATTAKENPAEQQPIEWYVMRVTYQRELVARRLLEELGIECFVPTEKVKRRKTGGGTYLREVARLHNYIFVHTSLEVLAEVKSSKIPYLRYMMAPDGEGHSRPQFVREKDMENFMAVCRSEGAKMLDSTLDLRAGDRVRIVNGPLKGVEGIYIRIASRHEKRVVVRLEAIATVATAAFPATDIEKI